MKITSNNQWYEFYTFYDISEAEQSEVLETYEKDEAESINFVKIRGEFYSLNNFMRADKPIGNRWLGYFATSYFSAYLIEISNCGTCYRIGYQTS